MTSSSAASSTTGAMPLTEADIAFGIILGQDRSIPAVVPRRPSIEPIVALEAVLARALSRPPCVVSFSGGRDSSALLAVATRLARRDGHELPIPATLRFPESPAADEDEWQRVVLAHLGLNDWVRIDIVGDQLDAVGPIASTALRRHGLVWPFNAHFHVPVFEEARGGSVVTGFGGDELALSSASVRAGQVLTGKVTPRLSDILAVGMAAAPHPLRLRIHRRRQRPVAKSLPWLTPDGQRGVADAIGASDASVPLGWSRVLRSWIPRDRYFAVCQHSLALLAGGYDVEIAHPFVAPEVLDALAAAGGIGGLGDRDALMLRLFGDLLPEQSLRRGTKASFSEPLWTATARRFAASWSGDGLNRDWVDVDALRRHWLDEQVDLRSTTLLQAAWLHDAQAGALDRTRENARPSPSGG